MFLLCAILGILACNAKEKRLQAELDYCEEESNKMKRQLVELSETVEILESQLQECQDELEECQNDYEECQFDLENCKHEVSDLEFENLMRD